MGGTSKIEWILSTVDVWHLNFPPQHIIDARKHKSTYFFSFFCSFLLCLADFRLEKWKSVSVGMWNLLFASSMRFVSNVDASFKYDCVSTAPFFTLRFEFYSMYSLILIRLLFCFLLWLFFRLKPELKVKTNNSKANGKWKEETKWQQQHIYPQPHANPPSNTHWHRVLRINLYDCMS